jgi:MFS superfamily sulfate permease-like transporter
MFREINHTRTEAIIDLVRTLPEREQKIIVKTLSSPKPKKGRKNGSAKTEQDVLDSIKRGLEEIKESKRTGKPMKTLDEFLNEI